MTLKAFGLVALALLVALGAGWVWGAAGKATLSAERRALEERATIAEARLALLDARTSLQTSDFGDAARYLETSRTLASGLQVRLRELGQAARAGHVEIVLAHVRDAERLAAARDSGAQEAVVQAVEALRNITPATAPRVP